MSLLPQQILPQTVPLGTVTLNGELVPQMAVTIDKNWWLFLYNIVQQVTNNGSGPTLSDIANLSLFRAKGPDYTHEIMELRTTVALLPDRAGRIAALEQRVADLEKLTLLRS